MAHGHVAAAMARSRGLPALLGTPCRSRDLAFALIRLPEPPRLRPKRYLLAAVRAELFGRVVLCSAARTEVGFRRCQLLRGNWADELDGAGFFMSPMNRERRNG